jgi:hypothetical protein
VRRGRGQKKKKKKKEKKKKEKEQEEERKSGIKATKKPRARNLRLTFSFLKNFVEFFFIFPSKRIQLKLRILGIFQHKTSLVIQTSISVVHSDATDTGFVGVVGPAVEIAFSQPFLFQIVAKARNQNGVTSQFGLICWT